LPRLPPLLLAFAALLALLPATGASAASVKKCASPKGTRAPTRGLHAGYATSCAMARAVARNWDKHCEPSTALCQVQTGGRHWSCRASVFAHTPRTPARYRSDVYLKCGRKETSKGRPAANFHQAGAAHECAHPERTEATIRFLIGYYDAPCKVATRVAEEWDRACDPGEDGSRCSFSTPGDRWTCEQHGRPGVDSGYGYVCTAPGVGKGRPAVTFGVRVIPLPPGVPDEG
jgi:hypothetical protein